MGNETSYDEIMRRTGFNNRELAEFVEGYTKGSPSTKVGDEGLVQRLPRKRIHKAKKRRIMKDKDTLNFE